MDRYNSLNKNKKADDSFKCCLDHIWNIYDSQAVYSDIKYIQNNSKTKSWYFAEEVQKIKGAHFDFTMQQVKDTTKYSVFFDWKEYNNTMTLTTKFGGDNTWNLQSQKLTRIGGDQVSYRLTDLSYENLIHHVLV